MLSAPSNQQGAHHPEFQSAARECMPREWSRSDSKTARLGQANMEAVRGRDSFHPWVSAGLVMEYVQGPWPIAVRGCLATALQTWTTKLPTAMR